MPSETVLRVAWVVLTTGDRPTAVAAAMASVLDDDPDAEVFLIANGGGAGTPLPDRATLIELPENVGIPGGRHHGALATAADVVGFLDDDAVVQAGASEMLRRSFDEHDRLGAVSLRLIDERGRTQRRHVPRPGAERADAGGAVALFLGGASAIRREAYFDAGGYFTELFYAHEELELSWRLIDRGWDIQYLADAIVFHPHTEVGRHADGWSRSGRNRVWIARRTLPWPIAAIHVGVWLILGAARAPKGPCRRSYLSGWRHGWRGRIERAPVSWRTVWRLVRLGRPPIV